MARHLYVTPAEFKSSASVPEGLADDDVERALSAASGCVEELCHRKFWLDPVAVTRTYTAMTSRMVVVDDLAFIDSVVSDGTAIAASDYKAEPLNAHADGKPYLWLVSPTYAFSTDHAAVEITGRFGWPETPDQIHQFVTIVAARLVKRVREAPFGVTNVGLDGAAMRIAQEDPEMRTLIRKLIRNFPVVA